jgi:hypothetical protein
MLATLELEWIELTQDPVPNFSNDGNETSRELTVQLNPYPANVEYRVSS